MTDADMATARRLFIAHALDQMAPRFAAPIDDDPELVGRQHYYMFIWEELCDLFEDAGLAEGVWPAWWADPDDPRIDYMQPPVYRQIVSPADTLGFLLERPLPSGVTAVRALAIWAELFSEYWPLGAAGYLPIGPDLHRIAAAFRDQLLRLDALGFVQISGLFFRWHPLVLQSRAPGEHWSERLYAYDELTFSED